MKRRNKAQRRKKGENTFIIDDSVGKHKPMEEAICVKDDNSDNSFVSSFLIHSVSYNENSQDIIVSA